MVLRVLAIDDSRTMRDLLRFTLEDIGFEVFVASDGIDGVERFEETGPDVVITDINMPRLDGFGVIEAVRASKRFGSIPILVLSTESSSESKDRARRCGATGWIVKPFDCQRLVAAIRRVVKV